MNWLQPFFFCLQNIFPSPMYKTTNFTAYKLTTIYPPPTKFDMLDNIYILTDTELCNRIAAKIKTVRLKQNMSQAELADKSGVSISTIKRMEDGEVKNFESLIRVLRTLGKLDIFIPLVEEEQLEYYELASKANKPKRKRASKGYTKENKEESEW